MAICCVMTIRRVVTISNAMVVFSANICRDINTPIYGITISYRDSIRWLWLFYYQLTTTKRTQIKIVWPSFIAFLISTIFHLQLFRMNNFCYFSLFVGIYQPIHLELAVGFLRCPAIYKLISYFIRIL